MPTLATTPRMFRSAGGAVGADDEIGPAQGVEVRRVVGGVEDAVEQLAELLGRRRRIDVEQGVQRLGGRQVMGLGADAADPRRQVRHVLGRPAHAELLEAAQLGNLQIGVGHIALVVQEDVDLAVTFQPGDRDQWKYASSVKLRSMLGRSNDRLLNDG